MRVEKSTIQDCQDVATTLLARVSKLHLLIVSLSFFCILSWSADASAAWVKRYNGPGNQDDWAKAIAVDSSGNVYVTGQSPGTATSGSDDYATIKYDTNGNRKWVKRYNGPGNMADIASAIAVDSSGNVYVTGQSPATTTSGSDDYATIKYDTNGNQKWVKRYNGLGNYFDAASAIAVDRSGNVYVTGQSYTGGNSGYDYATIKYDTNGNRKWVKRYTGPEHGSMDGASAIAVDSSGNVYVTGESTGGTSSYDYATIKYDTNGNQKWVKRYTGPGGHFDSAGAIAVDKSGNVYVTGQSTGTSSGTDYATVKYDANGNQKWVKRYNGPGNDFDVASAIAVDSSANVYVTGKSPRSTFDTDYATIKYDTNGNQKWVKRYTGPGGSFDGANAIAVDRSANVYVTGQSMGINIDMDYVTIKYSTTGDQRWVKRYTGPGEDRARAIAVDTSGNVYVTGESTGTTSSFDYTTIKYDTNGN